MLDRMRITLAATILSGSLLFSNYDTNIVYAKQKPDIVDATSQGSSLEDRIKKISVSYSDEDFAYNQAYEKAKNIVTHLSSKKQFPSNTWEIIALSHISEGLVNYEQNHPDKKEEIKGLLELIIQDATTKLSPYNHQLNAQTSLKEDGIYLSHTEIILNSYQQLTKNQKYIRLQTKIAHELARRSLNDPQKHMRSYAHLKYKWPADQAATLYAIWSFDQNNGTTLSKEPIKEWFTYIKKNATDSRTRLPYSNITGKRFGKTPRGCALSWSIRYMGSFAPSEAKSQWSQYKKKFYVQHGPAHGFREWPKGINHRGDGDSGPIIYGMGVAASAFGMSAAKVLQDYNTYQKLKNTQDLAEELLILMPQKGMKNTEALTQSILFYTLSIL